ncbi:hypothetical protein BC939DRAFT_29501 [Gamsiella multidivaricata]|uniref:uncharacterized protein n=1 Tax=Gamsiella multidivaricata TaxID=101098 RepID=UPI00221FE7F8|nr:uncharacterized protein BC939DRAFT_29501 [Gamsiella multidivaricata]KAI7816828.1 hypothetical protein BC939DRAFT_29501 [Gamsiella multidivaricata]
MQVESISRDASPLTAIDSTIAFADSFSICTPFVFLAFDRTTLFDAAALEALDIVLLSFSSTVVMMTFAAAWFCTELEEAIGTLKCDETGSIWLQRSAWFCLGTEVAWQPAFELFTSAAYSLVFLRRSFLDCVRGNPIPGAALLTDFTTAGGADDLKSESESESELESEFELLLLESLLLESLLLELLLSDDIDEVKALLFVTEAVLCVRFPRIEFCLEVEAADSGDEDNAGPLRRRDVLTAFVVLTCCLQSMVLGLILLCVPVLVLPVLLFSFWPYCLPLLLLFGCVSCCCFFGF